MHRIKSAATFILPLFIGANGVPACEPEKINILRTAIETYLVPHEFIHINVVHEYVEVKTELDVEMELESHRRLHAETRQMPGIIFRPFDEDGMRRALSRLAASGKKSTIDLAYRAGALHAVVTEDVIVSSSSGIATSQNTTEVRYDGLTSWRIDRAQGFAMSDDQAGTGIDSRVKSRVDQVRRVVEQGFVLPILQMSDIVDCRIDSELIMYQLQTDNSLLQNITIAIDVQGETPLIRGLLAHLVSDASILVGIFDDFEVVNGRPMPKRIEINYYDKQHLNLPDLISSPNFKPKVRNLYTISYTEGLPSNDLFTFIPPPNFAIQRGNSSSSNTLSNTNLDRLRNTSESLDANEAIRLRPSANRNRVTITSVASILGFLLGVIGLIFLWKRK